VYRVAVSAVLLLLFRFVLHASWAMTAAVTALFLLGQLAFWWAWKQQHGPKGE
jgi:hypothetical protein